MSKMSFNPMQQIAVDHIDGPLLIIAGAGSGKTSVLTGRIAKIIEDGHAKPYEILAITFTNKAAKEMRERVARLVGDVGKDMWVMTFHAMCARILRRNIADMKRNYTSNFTIYDDSDAVALIKQCVKELDINLANVKPKSIKYHISAAKNQLRDPEAYLKFLGPDFNNEIICNIYAKYEELMEKNNALDFDDLLVKTLELFVTCNDVLSYYQRRFKYIHVDEYQDTNAAQYNLVKLLSYHHGNICVVGDDDQGIYSWRGADISNILDFEKDFPNSKMVKLEQNYRSTKNILFCANKVIINNKERMDKELWTKKDAGDKIKLYRGETERHEALFICKEIQKLMGKYDYSDIAILYRTNAQSQVIETTLLNNRIPYDIYGGTKFYDRKEVKDLIAYLRLLVNPKDDMAVNRIINIPRRGIGNTTMGKLSTVAVKNNISLMEVLVDEDLVLSIVSRAAKKVKEFVALMDRLKNFEAEDIVEHTRFVIRESGLETMYVSDKSDDAEMRLANMEELPSAMHRFIQDNEDVTLESFLENVALVTDLDSMDEENRHVTLMTMHGAKGLEFPVVFVCGFEESLFPHQRSLADDDQMQEERRLCYVAMTRPKYLLYLSYAVSRTMYGMPRYNMVSRFIREIPMNVVENINDKNKPKKKSNSNSVRKTFNINNYKTNSIKDNKFSKGKSSKTDGKSYNIGDKVKHKTFGDGMILDINGQGNKRILVIAFAGKGVKELSEKIAPLTKL